MSAERPMTPLEMLAYMVEQNAPAYAITNQRRLCGLPSEPAPAIVIRTVPAPAPRPKARRKSSAPKPSAPTPATSKSRVSTRFDLKD
jgi:hypothetical protein